MSQEKSFDLAIVGAGVPGIMLALKMAKTGLNVALLEKQKLPKDKEKPDFTFTNGRSVALMKTSCDELEAWGVLEKLKDIICPLECLQIIDDSYFSLGDFDEDKMRAQKFYADELGQPRFGYNIPLEPLLSCMRSLLATQKNIHIFDEVDIDAIEFAEHEATLKWKKHSISAKLVIGADSRESVVRSMAGIGVRKKEYGAKALTCVVSHSEDHDNTSTEFHRSGGPFTLVPLPNQKSAIVWSEKDEDAEKFLSMSDEELQNAIQQRSRGIVGEIKLESKLFAWPLISMQAEKVTAPRCALIAEAAHVMSPIGAQGLNLSLRDMHDLADIIKNAALNGLDIGSASILNQYKKQRFKDMTLRNRGVDLFHRSVANKNPLMRKIRRSILQTVPMITPLREALMKEGLSLKG
jgi:2-octaprenyl-6-methoxyphenol hydroxylase